MPGAAGPDGRVAIGPDRRAPIGPDGRAADGPAALLRLALPMVASRAGLAVMLVTDSWLLARHSSAELARASLAFGTFGRLTDVLAAVVLSGLPLVAAAAGRPGGSEAVWRRAMALALGLGGLGLLAGLFWRPVLDAVIVDPALVEGAAAVTSMLAPGLPAALVALACAMLLEGLRRPGLVAAIVVGANGLNLLLNWALIGGHLGLPALGAYGSAIATTLVRVALAAALGGAVLAIVGRSSWMRRDPDPGGAAAQNRLALGAGVTGASFHALAIWLTIFAGRLGPEALAAYASCWIVTMPAMFLAFGIGDAMGVRAASPGAAPGIVRRDCAWLALVLVPIALGLMAAPVAIASVYAAEPALRDALAGLLALGAPVLVVDGLSYALVATARARGDVAVPTAIHTGCMALTVATSGTLAFGLGLGVGGLVGGVLAAGVLRLALLAWRSRARRAIPLSLAVAA